MRGRPTGEDHGGDWRNAAQPHHVRTMSRRPRASILLLGGLFSGPTQLAAQSVTGSEPRVVARTMLGETAIVIHAKRPGVVQIGLAADSGALTLDLVASDARRFSSALSGRLTPRRAGRRAAWTERLEEPGVGAGLLSLSLAIAGKDSTFTLFASDESLSIVRQAITYAEARVLAKHLTTAAALALPPTSRGRTRPKGPNAATKRP